MNNLKLETSINSFEEIENIGTDIFLFGKYSNQQNVFLREDKIVIKYGQHGEESVFLKKDFQKAKEFYDNLYNLSFMYADKVRMKDFIKNDMQVDIAYWTKEGTRNYIQIGTTPNGYYFSVSKGNGVFDYYTPPDPKRKGYIKVWETAREAKKALIKYLNF